MNFKIRPATGADAKIIAAFQVAMARETEEKLLDALTVTAGVENVLQNPNLGHFLVATDEKNTVIAALLITFEWSEWRNGQFWWIQSVYVVPEARGSGIFRALFAEVKKRAQSSEMVCGLRLYVERDNQKAQAVYTKLGMEETPYRIFEEEF